MSDSDPKVIPNAGRLPPAIPLVVALVGLIVMLVGAFIHHDENIAGRLGMGLLLVGLGLISFSRVLQETRLTPRK